MTAFFSSFYLYSVLDISHLYWYKSVILANRVVDFAFLGVYRVEVLEIAFRSPSNTSC